MMDPMIEKILSNKIIATPLLVSIAAASVVAIAGGFVGTYKLITFLFN